MLILHGIAWKQETEWRACATQTPHTLILTAVVATESYTSVKREPQDNGATDHGLRMAELTFDWQVQAGCQDMFS